MLNNIWNLIEYSGYRNAIILVILLTAFTVILIFFMKIFLKSNKPKKNQ